VSEQIISVDRLLFTFGHCSFTDGRSASNGAGMSEMA
jgi:hypothetical protein